ncbi:MAG: isoprenylcysteine carboxylmethyltransferase family protein [Ignavibacteria bacterium]|nr:isoprenylcysteine carboxylmethyltransferase family protein [Ignavibacteria bacterium]
MNIGKFFFKYRSYTPLPFLILMILYSNPNIYSMIFGFLFVVLGEFIRIWANSWAGSETRTTGGVGGTFLIVSGPYAYVRNPLYIGNVIIYFGLGIMSNAVFPYLQILALVYFFYQYYEIVKEEENFLKQKFGDEYKDYCSKVNRFLPKFSKYENSKIEQPEFSWKKGWQSEVRSIQASLSVIAILVLIWIIRRV